MKTKTLLDSFQSFKYRDMKPEELFGSPSSWPRGTRMTIIGRDGPQWWLSAGRWHRRWRRIR